MEHARRRERSRLVRSVRLLRTRHPRTFTEKVRYKMLRDHRPLLVTFADKAAVRDHVAERVGDGYLPHAFGILDDPDELLSLDLPDRYVVKPTHGSGAAIVVSPTAPAEARLPEARWSWTYRHVDPSHVDRSHLAAIGRHWMRQLYGQGPNREWAYGLVPRRILVEEMLAGPDGSIPDDYKVFVFHGRAHFIQVDAGRFGGRTQDFYTPTWTHLPMSGGPPWVHPPRPRPERLDEILHVAETLGAETDFVRVDLYSLPDRIVFGELTSYPAGGESPFDPISFDAEFGRPWTVPPRY
ncbi:hypothetical protein NY547_08940 [Cnuibacter physcomitrellae]|uniref:ATP-grasp fold amidoligase family protein n=1 Tax=Cnuibacter physcomitrellae TaxID=1619308 RepID=UPI002175A555|nr:ATP-grasp fold amidoligase family protein [Cnuibacter physcomitrellae]MCS5497360.1 hypothetical protein [Cnuibacter physcomitrellae]